MAHRAAYDLCSTKEVRNVFRRMMAEHADWHDWAGMGSGGARVPSALTDEMQEHQTAKQKDRRAAMREKARERASKAADKAAARPSRPPRRSSRRRRRRRRIRRRIDWAARERRRGLCCSRGTSSRD